MRMLRVMTCSLLAVIASGILISRAQGQEFRDVTIRGQGGGGDEEEDRLAGVLTAALMEMERVCELNPEQLTKLRVAVKGAVESHQRGPAEAKVADGDRLDHIGVGFGAGVDPPKARPNAGRRQVVTINGSHQPNLSSITDNVVWVKAVRSVLTKGQLKPYQAALAERAKFRQTALALRLVAAIDQALMLSSEQREQLRGVLERRLAIRDNANIGLVLQMFGSASMGVDSELPSALMLVRSNEVEEILDGLQMKLWKSLRTESLSRRFGGFGLEQEEDFEIEVTHEGLTVYAVSAVKDEEADAAPDDGDR